MWYFVGELFLYFATCGAFSPKFTANLVQVVEMEWDNAWTVQSMINLVQLFTKFNSHDGLLFTDGLFAHILMSAQLNQKELMDVALVAVKYMLPCLKDVLAPMWVVVDMGTFWCDRKTSGNSFTGCHSTGNSSFRMRWMLISWFDFPTVYPPLWGVMCSIQSMESGWSEMSRICGVGMKVCLQRGVRWQRITADACGWIRTRHSTLVSTWIIGTQAEWS